MQHELEDFLVSAEGIQCAEPEVRELARRVARGSANEVEAARRLFDYVRDTVRYSVRVPFERMEDYLALNTLARGAGYCVQKSALLCTLARALGIPSRLGFADIINHQLPDGILEITGGDVIYYHCFLEWYVGGRWLKVTPSFDRRLTEERGWRLVEFDGEHDAMLPATTLDGSEHITYTAYHGWRLELPLSEMMDAWLELCGEDCLLAWRRQGQIPEGKA